MNTNGYYNEISTIIFLPVYAVNQIDRCKEPKGNKKRFITYNSPSWQCTTLHSLWSILPYVECCVQHYIPHIVADKIWKMCNLGKINHYHKLGKTRWFFFNYWTCCLVVPKFISNIFSIFSWLSALQIHNTLNTTCAFTTLKCL